MLPGFNPTSTEALGRAVDALDDAARRISDLRSASCALEGLAAEDRGRLLGTIDVFADLEADAALDALDAEALAALALASEVVSQVATLDEAERDAFARSIEDRDVYALELAAKTRARLGP